MFWGKFNSSENNIVSVEAQLLQYPLTLSLYLHFDNQGLPIMQDCGIFWPLRYFGTTTWEFKTPFSPTTSFKDGEVLGVLPIKSYLWTLAMKEHICYQDM